MEVLEVTSVGRLHRLTSADFIAGFDVVRFVHMLDRPMWQVTASRQ